MATEGFFDFLRGDKTISITEPANLTEAESPILKNEKWILYTMDPESIQCPLDCLVVHNYFKIIKPDTIAQTKIVGCASCTPNGRLPILVAESNGHVLELPAIIETFFEIDDLLVYEAFDGVLGGYIRANGNSANFANVIDLIDSLNSTDLSDPAITILLFSLIQAAKMHLKSNDSVRSCLERNEFLGEMFINLLESVQVVK